MIDCLSLSPFNLNAQDVAWVLRTRDALSTDDKLRQLFVFAQLVDDAEQGHKIGDRKAGGVFRIWGADLEKAWKTTRAVLDSSEIPPFVAGDLEGGGYNFPGMSPMPNQMGVAAMNDPELSQRVADVVAVEARAMGFNWNFGPVVDINAQHESAIVGTRSYGVNPTRIVEQALVYIGAMQRNEIAATAKHWPGEGFDARDQHLVTTVNPQSMAEWRASFGRIYSQVIEAGVLSVMSAHIALPSWIRELQPDARISAFKPASVSHELNTVLLRQRLGFNGLVVTDASSMGGFNSWAERAAMVPQTIESGCDVFLFSRDPDGDLGHMRDGLRSGLLSERRLEEAVTRILAMKAKLGLHRKAVDERLMPLEPLRGLLRNPRHMRVAELASAASITCVKNLGVLPLDPIRHRRVVVASGGIETNHLNAQHQPLKELLDGMTAAGFEVRPFEAEEPPTRANTDLVLYLVAKESSMMNSRVYLDWRVLHGNSKQQAMRRYWHEIPTVMVSFGHPGHLMDAPRVPAYVNAYSAIQPVQAAVLRKLLGQEPFYGDSPVDAFCGLEDARW
jgi:beta-N-acetylhexosaminidase